MYTRMHTTHTDERKGCPAIDRRLFCCYLTMLSPTVTTTHPHAHPSPHIFALTSASSTKQATLQTAELPTARPPPTSPQPRRWSWAVV